MMDEDVGGMTVGEGLGELSRHASEMQERFAEFCAVLRAYVDLLFAELSGEGPWL